MRNKRKRINFIKSTEPIYRTEEERKQIKDIINQNSSNRFIGNEKQKIKDNEVYKR